MNADRGRVLLVEDNEDLRFAARRFLGRRGFAVFEAGSVAEAEACFAANRPEVVIVDYRLPDGNGLSLLTSLRRRDPELSAIVLTGLATIELAVEAIKQGADQFLPKPVELESLARIAQRLCEARRAKSGGGAASDLPSEPDPFLGDSPAIRQLAEDAEQVAAVHVPVLIEGETGSGKGVLARWLHRHGSRREEPWVDLNCAGLSPQLLESELFGHARGAFTGAVTAKPGLLEVADRGTLFLDEIGDMSLDVQPRLLKVLEEKAFRRLGDVRERNVDVRLIAASHHDLHERAEAGAFRLDLLYRIESVRLVVPPLRERGDDLISLSRNLIARLTPVDRPRKSLDADAEGTLAAHAWPGNVRELRNVLERVVLFGRGETIGAEDVRRAIANGRRSSVTEDDQTLEAAERRHIRGTLRRLSGDVRRAAGVLGISRSGLYKKLQRHGLSPGDLQTARSPSGD